MKWRPACLVQFFACMLPPCRPHGADSELMPLACSIPLFLLELPFVEVEFLALQDVTVAPAALARAGGDAGEKPTALELVLDRGVKLLFGLTSLLLGNDMMTPLHFFLLLLVLICTLCRLSSLLLLTQVNTIPSQVPLLEWLGINLDDGILDKRLRAHQLVAGGIVDHVEEAHLPCAVL